MTAKEAFRKLKSELPDLAVISCTEYESIFVFNTSAKGFDGLWSVEKDSGKIENFKPFMIPISEYNNGKIVFGKE